jgi:hypothetical protein
VQAIARAWNSLSWRHWLIAAAIGVFMGAVYGTFYFLYGLDQFLARPGLPVAKVLINIVTRWVILMTGVAFALAFALALLLDISRRGPIRPRDVAVAIVAVAALARWSSTRSRSPNYYQRLAPDAGAAFHRRRRRLTMLSRVHAVGRKITTVVGTVILSAVYYFRTRARLALAVAQLGLSTPGSAVDRGCRARRRSIPTSCSRRSPGRSAFRRRPDGRATAARTP